MDLLIRSTVKAFLTALILTPIARDIFRAYNIVDKPGYRKIHAYPIPRIGGIPIAIAYVISLIAISDPVGSIPSFHSATWRFLPGAATIFLIGLLDDFFTFRPLVKLAGEVLAAVLVFAAGLRVESVAHVTLPIWLSFPITLFWLLLTTNALNLIDGLDGLCTGIGLMSTLALFSAAVLHNNNALAAVTLPLAGALVGFLCFNFNPATVFLGDSGALLIGFLLGCYSILWTEKSTTVLGLLVPLLGLSIPLLDVLLSIVRRFLQNKPIFTADRGHIHHRLLDRGLKPLQAVLILYGFAALIAGCGILLVEPRFGRYQGVCVLAICTLIGIGIRQLRYSEFALLRRWLSKADLPDKPRDRVLP